MRLVNTVLWFRRQDWPLWCDLVPMFTEFADFDEWEAWAQQQHDARRTEVGEPLRLPVYPEMYAAWCRVHGFCGRLNTNEALLAFGEAVSLFYSR